MNEKESQRQPSVIHLRSEPQVIAEEEAKSALGIKTNRRPREYISNDFEVQGACIIDHATGLMWQQSGSDSAMKYEQAQNYLEGLNQQRFAGYDDWRLPTIPELVSLLEPEKQPDGLYCALIFDAQQSRCWSADRLPAAESPGLAWFVNFNYSHVHCRDLYDRYYIRAVRSL